MSSLIDGNYALITSSSRKIGTIIPNIVLEEVQTDTMRITDHPVETGSAISDHAFVLPAEVLMRCMWSDSTGQYEGYSRAIYEALLKLQESREPFDVSTGKRQYKNMLVSMLHIQSNEETEHALLATVGLRYINLTSTETGSGGSSKEPAQTSNPAQTSPSGLSSSFGNTPTNPELGLNPIGGTGSTQFFIDQAGISPAASAYAGGASGVATGDTNPFLVEGSILGSMF